MKTSELSETFLTWTQNVSSYYIIMLPISVHVVLLKDNKMFVLYSVCYFAELTIMGKGAVCVFFFRNMIGINYTYTYTNIYKYIYVNI